MQKVLTEKFMNKQREKNKDCNLLNNNTKSLNDVFDERITDWIQDYKDGVLKEEDVINVTKKVAKYRNDPNLLNDIKSRMGID